MITRTYSTFLAIAFLLLGMSCYIQFAGGDAGDKNWLLYAAGMLLKGKKLYVDIVEANPPLIHWLYSIPVYIARKINVEDYHVLVMLGLCAIASTIVLVLRLVQYHSTFNANVRRQLELALLLAFVLIFRVDPSYFFDRDHIFIVLTLPYVLRWLPSLARTSFPLWLNILVGGMAAIGFSIKPHCLIVFAGIQLLYLLRERSFAILASTENIILYVGVTFYLLCIFYFEPAYVYTVFPMALQTYGAFARRLEGLLYVCIALLTFAASFVDFRLGHSSPFRRDIYYLAGLCIFLLCYGLSNNGWGYSYNPLITYLLVISGWLIWEFSYLRQLKHEQGVSAKQFTYGLYANVITLSAHAIFGMLIIIGCFVGVWRFHCEEHPSCMTIMQEVKTPQGVRSFATMSIVMGNWSQVSRASGAPWQSRFISLWMVYKFLISKADFVNSHRWILDYTGHALAEDLRKMKPEVVFIDSAVRPIVMHEQVDLPAYFSVYPDFKLEWQKYRYIHNINYCDKSNDIKTKNKTIAQGCNFDIYYRNPD